MTNELLIQQLDNLRISYSQQQKNATVLQSTLKALLDAQTKTHKALTDYSTHNTGADVSSIQTLLGSLPLKDSTDRALPDVRRETKTLAQIVNALKQAITALQSDPLDVVQLNKAVTSLQTARQQPIVEILPELTQELKVASEALGAVFGQKLRDALAKQQISIGGRPPKFEIGRFELDANFAGRFIVVRYGREVVIPRIGVTVDAALKAYQTAAKLITGRNLEGKVWMTRFYDAWQIARLKRPNDNARVNIVNAYVEMVILVQGNAFMAEPSKRTLTEYTRAQFIHDFAAFTHQRIGVEGRYVRAHSATKSQTDSPTKSMWIVEGDSAYDGRYIADIEFAKD